MLKMYVQCHKQASCIEVRRGKKANGRKNKITSKARNTSSVVANKKQKKTENKTRRILLCKKNFVKKIVRFLYIIFLLANN